MIQIGPWTLYKTKACSTSHGIYWQIQEKSILGFNLILTLIIIAGLGMQPSDVKPPNSEGYIGETQTSDSKINSDVPKGMDSLTFLLDKFSLFFSFILSHQ